MGGMTLVNSTAVPRGDADGLGEAARHQDSAARWRSACHPSVELLHHCTIQSQAQLQTTLPDLKSSPGRKNVVFTCGSSQSGAAQLRADTRAGAAETKLGGRRLGSAVRHR